ncbi:hypothetical protein Q7M45_02730 [Candidatus Liberibacter asiaticus]|uniref:Uncharacterized protein n=2 Tax=Liberibacter asiaticus TaxID=34021 RepID=C6XFH6_LIBAP|nr:hypothetical protein [Candidatus Liberibacter asiaticus]ACT57129.2 hypothetical protein CLIBASIA_02715 [Candidatus Liberibacter asiaticus str. psy62]AGH16906.1 hypothetical protein WSI_02680 [Candidatus Liberibacter asiaticus str. gxpsy]BAP26426.1 hypothetical protein CGUJ_02715 [Candidatus Liberibacter asiaticus str. Ishi-1]
MLIQNNLTSCTGDKIKSTVDELNSISSRRQNIPPSSVISDLVVHPHEKKEPKKHHE